MSGKSQFKFISAVLVFTLFTTATVRTQTTDGFWQDLSGNLPALTTFTSFPSAMQLVGDDLYIAGYFEEAGGVPGTAGLAVWNGEYWRGVGGGLNGPVYCMQVVGTDVYVGGDFTDAGGNPDADYIAKWDGATWEALGTGLQEGPFDLVVVGSDVYASGEFTDAGGNPDADYIAKWNGSSWEAVGTPLTNGPFIVSVDIMVFADTILYIAGEFQDAGGDPNADGVAKWNGVSYEGLGSGLGTYPGETIRGFVRDMAAVGTDLYVGGIFENTGGVAEADGFAKWNGSAWEAVGTVPINDGFVVEAVGSDVYVVDAGEGSSLILKWSGSSWSQIGEGFTDGLPIVFAIDGLDIFIGGPFRDAGGRDNSDYVAKWSGATWLGLGTGVNDEVSSVLVEDDNIYVAGNFTNAGGVDNADRIACWNGSGWQALGQGLNDYVSQIMAHNGYIYAVGSFTDAGGSANADGIARWNGSAWEALGTGLEGFVEAASVFAIAARNDDIYIAGLFQNAGGNANADYIAKWNGSSWEALGTALNGAAILTMAILGNDLYVGGNFENAGGNSSMDMIARWNGSSWSSLGSGLNQTVSALAVDGDDLIIGGDFTDAGGNPNSDYLVKWNGQSFVAAANQLNGSVSSLLVNGDDLYAYGDFINAGGNVDADRFARWDKTGWYSVGALSSGQPLFDMAMSGYDVIVGGGFTNIEGTLISNIARWQNIVGEPSAQATNLTFSNASSSSVDLSFDEASGTPRGYLVLRKSGAASTSVPVDETDYSVGEVLGDAVVVHNGTQTSFADGGVIPGAVYHYAVFSYNGTGEAVNYRTTNPLRNNITIGVVSAPVAANSVSTQNTTGSAYPTGFPDLVWRMFSVPVNLDNKSISAILAEFGEPGNSTWRMFQDDLEVSLSGQLEPGQAYWLKQIHIPGGKQVTLGAGTTASAADAAIVLVPGWNQIANPFAFPIDWDNNTDAGANPDIKGPVAYDGSKYVGLGQTLGDNTPFTTLNPFDGYWVYNSAATNQTLNIDPTSAYPKTGIFRNSNRVTDWRIQIVVENGNYSDQFNYIGAGSDAKNGDDRFDLPELPVIGDHVSVAFDHAVDGRVVPYTIDYQTAGLNGYSWDFSVKTNLNGQNSLTWIPENLPANYVIQIMDLSKSRLVSQEGYTFSIPGKDQPARFKIWVGDVHFVQQAVEAYQADLPDRYSLSQNYPNPFNPTTTVTFDVARPGEVEIVVYNVLGQEVKTLASRFFQTGRYTTTWDGKDNLGRQSASGIYITRMQADGFSMSRRMLLIK